jgi:hypothetical protein
MEDVESIIYHIRKLLYGTPAEQEYWREIAKREYPLLVDEIKRLQKIEKEK